MQTANVFNHLRVPAVIFCLKSLLHVVAATLTYSFAIFTEQPLDHIGHLLLTISAKKNQKVDYLAKFDVTQKNT